MAQQHMTGSLKVEAGTLVPIDNASQARLRHYAKDLPEGTIVEVHYSVREAAGYSLPQLARVHAMIREIALNSGHTQKFVKEYVKTEAGLTKIDATGQSVVRSFTECSKDDLSRAIEVCVQFSQVLGIPLGEL